MSRIYDRIDSSEKQTLADVKHNISTVTTFVRKYLALHDVAAYTLYFLEEPTLIKPLIFDSAIRKTWPSVDSARRRLRICRLQALTCVDV